MNRRIATIALVVLVAAGCGDDAGPEATPQQTEAIGTLIDAELTSDEQRCILEELIASEIDPQTIIDGTVTGDEDAELLAVAVSCVENLAEVPAFVDSVIEASAEEGTPFTEAEAICVIDQMADDDPVSAASECFDADDDTDIDYGDDEVLDLLWDSCENGNNQSCDELYVQAPLESAYLEFARTCGGRLPDSVGLRCFLDLG